MHVKILCTVIISSSDTALRMTLMCINTYVLVMACMSNGCNSSTC